MAADMEVKESTAEVVAVDKIKVQPQNKATRGFNQKFLDLFWRLAENDAGARLNASIELIKQLDSAQCTESQVSYSINRLVQGLASTRQSARHGYFITLLGALNSFSTTRVPNQLIHDSLQKSLKIEGGSKERVDNQIGQILAYGALVKSGRLSATDDILSAVNSFFAGCKMKTYIQPIAYGFVEELIQHVDQETFKKSLWTVLQPELTLPWEQHTFDTLNLLLAAHERFPKIVKKAALSNSLGVDSLSDPECFTNLTQFIVRNSSYTEHPILAKIVATFQASNKLNEFWIVNIDAALESDPIKAKVCSTIFHLLLAAWKIVDDETVGKLLTPNVVKILVGNLQAKEESTLPLAESVMGALKNLIAKEDVTAKAQLRIMKHLLKSADNMAFDKATDTRFVVMASPSLKKEAVVGLVEMYHQCVAESNRNDKVSVRSKRDQDKILMIHHLIKLMNVGSMNREVEWKASQLFWLARLAYFTPISPSASKVLVAAAKEAFHRALDGPCKKLADLSLVLSKAFEQINSLVPTSDLTEEVKLTWKHLVKNVNQIEKKESAAKPNDRWTYQVFLVLYLNLGFEMLRDPAMPKEVIDELDTCYAKATEVKKKKKPTRRTTRSKLQEEEEEEEETVDDPHWLEVVTDILLSLLSRDQHLLRTVVVSVWSMLAEHLTVDALQQVLDVIDPSKKENPLMDADEDEDSGEEEGEEEGNVSGEEEDNEVGGGEVEADNEDEDDDMEDEDMDDEEEETVTDKLRMRIHEALGDSAALTDTESIDVDDLSDGQMESLDKALASAFKEFRQSRPAPRRGKAAKLPKDQTALMHFRIRCLDLVEVLADKEVDVRLSTAAILPLLSLLEMTVKEPLQKVLMLRTRVVLRKLTNIRRFTTTTPSAVGSDLVKLLQLLFNKYFAKRALMPYINDDLVHCCSFVLRSTLHLNREAATDSVADVLQLYKANLGKFFGNRDSPLPIGLFMRAFGYPWPEAGQLLEPLVEYAFSTTVLKNRKYLAISLLKALVRNVAALGSLDRPTLISRVETLLNNSQRVLAASADNSAAGPNDKYLIDLLALLRIVYQCPLLADADRNLWTPFKDSLASFAQLPTSKNKDLRKAVLNLARTLGFNVPEPTTINGASTTSKKKEKKIMTSTPTTTIIAPTQVNGADAAATASSDPAKKVPKKRPANKQSTDLQAEKKEAKKRRQEASAKGLITDAATNATVFTRAADIIDVDLPDQVETSTQDEENKGKMKKKVLRKTKGQQRKEEEDKTEASDNEHVQVSEAEEEEEEAAERKKTKKKKKKNLPIEET